MRVLIFTNKKKKPYSSYVLALLSEFLVKKDSSSKQKNSFAKTDFIKNESEYEVITRELPSGFFSIFHCLYLYYFLRKQKIKALVQFAGKSAFSSGLPQLIIPVTIDEFIIKKTLPASAKIVVASQFEKQKLAAASPLIEQNIYVLPASASSSFQPLSWSDKQAVKMEFAQGKEYFLVNSNGKTEETFTSLLKAFSSFKKWQHSSMKLVVNGRLPFTQNKDWTEKMSTYRYREDVIITAGDDTEKRVALLAAAYAFIHVPLQDNDVVPLLEAMQCDTPCISFFTDTINEYTGTAVVVTDSNNYEQLGEKMILLYKDETLRSRLIEDGKKQSQLYAKDNALQMLTSLLPAGIH